MGRKYRVILEVVSNFSGEPDEVVETKTVKDFIESMKGVGEISVKDYLDGIKGVGEIEVLSVDLPQASHRLSSASWLPESPTKRARRKPKV